MSDDDDIVLPPKVNKVHYGSLEEQEKARLAALAAAVRGETEEPSGKELGDIQTSSEYMDLEDEMSKDKKALLEEFERRRKARQLNVSTDDDEVRRSLRQLCEPVCLFGEGPAERRVRLRDLLSYLGEDAINKKLEEEEARISRERDREGTWYHEGPAELREARLWIARYSLPRAKARLNKARAELEQAGSVRAAVKQDVQRKAAAMGIYCSQIGDNRPISSCRFSADSSMLITSSWSGVVKIWAVPSFVEVATLKGHSCNVSAATFRPGVSMPSKFTDKVESQKTDGMDHTSAAADDSSTREVKAASCGYDGTVYLWNFDSESPVAELEGHSPRRVSKVEFHPSGRFLATTVYDHSWRLWDLHTMSEVLHQEGHAKPVHCIAFQEDGSLAVTGGLDALCRVWDLRTGRCVMLLAGHAAGVLGAAAGDHTALTAGGDHCLRAWDLRTRGLVYTLPAHTHLLSDVRYQPGGRHYVVTSSYDHTAKVWAHPGWHPLTTLQGHDNKVMSTDISPDSRYIATASYDRTIKLWTPELT